MVLFVCPFFLFFGSGSMVLFVCPFFLSFWLCWVFAQALSIGWKGYSFSVVPGLPVVVASLVVEHRLWAWPQLVQHRLLIAAHDFWSADSSSYGAWAQLFRSMWDLPWSGSSLCPRRWQADLYPLCHQGSLTQECGFGSSLCLPAWPCISGGIKIIYPNCNICFLVPVELDYLLLL